MLTAPRMRVLEKEMPAICSPGPACALVSSFKSPIWGMHVNGGVAHPTPAICRDPGQAAQAAMQTRKLTSTPAKGTSKDLMNPCFSLCNQIFFPLQSEDFSTDFSGVRIWSFPVGLRVTKGI